LPFDINKIRADFPILQRKIHGKPLVYLDNAATTQKPQVVIDRIAEYYAMENCNIHRGVHFLSQEATTAFENTREQVARFINARSKEEIVFTKGTTEAINLVASTFGRKLLQEGDEVLITALEHHSNLVPWQMLCHEMGARLVVAPINKKGEVMLDEFERLLGPRTRIAALAHVSNALGTINPLKEMISLAHSKDIPVLVDGAQAISHMKVDIQDLGSDFYCFSGHKAYGPMGVGVLCARQEFLSEMPPYQSGGEMVDRVSFEETTFNELPFKFEAGTPNVEAVLGLGTALSYMKETGLDQIAAYEGELLSYGTEILSAIDGLNITGSSSHKTGVISFNIGEIHPYDAGTIIDKYGIAVRTGHHCAQPVMDNFGIPGTIRASLAMYNTREELDLLAEAVRQVIKMFS
jgi:cysteine desulfurase/selenocysteine lyase